MWPWFTRDSATSTTPFCGSTVPPTSTVSIWCTCRASHWRTLYATIPGSRNCSITCDCNGSPLPTLPQNSSRHAVGRPFRKVLAAVSGADRPLCPRQPAAWCDKPTLTWLVACGARPDRIAFGFMKSAMAALAWLAGSVFVSELLGYLLHRLLHSGKIGFLSRSHMRHHLVLYGPLQPQRSREYLDATDERTSLGNIGIEWLVPGALLIVVAAGTFRVFHVRALFQS